MKKSKPIIPFLSGAAVTLLAVSCMTSALAASGKDSCDFVNVLMDGTRKITVGSGHHRRRKAGAPRRENSIL